MMSNNISHVTWKREQRKDACQHFCIGHITSLSRFQTFKCTVNNSCICPGHNYGGRELDRKLTQSLPPLYVLGVNPSYDEALEDIETTRHQLMDYLSKQRKRLGCNVSPFHLPFHAPTASSIHSAILTCDTTVM